MSDVKTHLFEVVIYDDEKVIYEEKIVAKDQFAAILLAGKGASDELDGYEADELRVVVRPFPL